MVGPLRSPLDLVRLEMERIADETGVAPARISFVAALRLIIDEDSHDLTLI
jgi:hypothetical protein